MKRYLITLISCLLLLPVSILGSEKVRMGVFDMEPSNISKDTAVAVSEMLRAELFSTGRFIIVDKKNMDKILKEQAFQQTGCTSSECAVEVGKILNVNIMATGLINKLGSSYNVSVTLTDVERGETLLIEKGSCDTEDKLAGITKNIASTLALKTPITGKVVKISADGSVVVDLGSADRVEKNMKFAVNRIKEEIKDSTGKVIMREYEDVGEIVLTEVQKEASRAIFNKKNDSSSIKEGDDVKIGEEDLKRMNAGIVSVQQSTVNSMIVSGGGSFIDPAWRSLILPGWGQFYNKDDLKGWIFTVVGLVALGETVAKAIDVNQKRQIYESETDTTKIETEYQTANDSYHGFQGVAGITIVVWSLNLLDAVISFDPKKHACAEAPNGVYCEANGPDGLRLGYTLKW